MANLNVTLRVDLQDEFENFMDARARELQGEWFDGKVAGITHKNADGVSRQDLAGKLSFGDELTLQPEPENPFDKNAIALYTPGEEQIGYLDARMAVEVCRVLKRGGQAKCFVRAVRQSRELRGVSFGLLSVPAKKDVG